MWKQKNRRPFRPLLLGAFAPAVAVGGVAATAQAAAIFDAETSSAWSVGTNWDGNAVPGATEDAIIADGLTATSSASGNVAGLLIVGGDGATDDTNGTLNITGGTLTTNNNVTLGKAGTSGAGTINHSAGTLTFGDRILLHDGPNVPSAVYHDSATNYPA